MERSKKKKTQLLQYKEPLTMRSHKGKNLDLMVRCP